jgi:hypothetical protein
LKNFLATIHEKNTNAKTVIDKLIRVCEAERNLKQRKGLPKEYESRIVRELDHLSYLAGMLEIYQLLKIAPPRVREGSLMRMSTVVGKSAFELFLCNNFVFVVLDKFFH